MIGISTLIAIVSTIVSRNYGEVLGPPRASPDLCYFVILINYNKNWNFDKNCNCLFTSLITTKIAIACARDCLNPGYFINYNKDWNFHKDYNFFHELVATLVKFFVLSGLTFAVIFINYNKDFIFNKDCNCLCAC